MAEVTDAPPEVSEKAKKIYAWSEIVLDRDEWGRTTKSVMPGEEVTQASLGFTKEQWKELLESGAVRSTPFPEMDETFQGSPVEWYRLQAVRAATQAELEAL